MHLFWQLDFIHIPGGYHSHFVLGLIHTHGVDRGLPHQVKMETVVIRILFKRIILWFVLLHSFQSKNYPAFHSKVIQDISKFLGIIYYLYGIWQPQSSEWA